MRSHPARLALAVSGIALAGVTLYGFTHLPVTGVSPARTVAVAATDAQGGVVVDAARPPWYGMKLLRQRVNWQAYTPPLHPPSIKASAAILVDPGTGWILFDLNATKELPPASTIKLLTALVVLQNFDPQRLVTVTQNALFQAPDESTMGLKAGQALTVQELLTGMLMASANDAADVFAVDTVGMERFVAAMNAQAAALGLRDTYVDGPVGLDSPHMISSALDLASLADVDVSRWSLFRNIVAMQSTYLARDATHPAFYLNNLNLLLHMYPAADGIKTGYTGNAGGCLVAMATRGSHRLISVILNADLVYSQSRKLLDWGFTQEGLPSLLPTPSPSHTPPAQH